MTTNVLATMRFENTKRVVTDADLADDLRRVATELSAATVHQSVYRERGKYSSAAVKQHFGSWNKALTEAGLSIWDDRDFDDDALSANLAFVWSALGRQPRKRDMRPPLSRFSHNPYVRRHGGWVNAIRSFLATANSETEPSEATHRSSTSRGPREPGLRLRFRVMRRDRFCCRHCGASPAKDPKVELHVDHIVPWKEGGATALENLQTLCIPCNLGKGSLSEEGIAVPTAKGELGWAMVSEGT